MRQPENHIGYAMNPDYLKTVFQVASLPPNWPLHFAVVTANNPNGISHSTEANQKFDNELRADLKLKNIWCWRVNGTSPDFSHIEPGFAMEVSLQEALELANRFKQEALFWIENDSLSIISCSSNEKINLGSWVLRLKQ